MASSNADIGGSSVILGPTEVPNQLHGTGHTRHDPMRARYRYLFEHSGPVKMLLSPKGTMLEVNDDCARTLGFPRVQLLGRNILEFVIATDRDRLAEMLARTFRHEPTIAQEVELDTIGGRRRVVFAPGHRDPLGGDQSGAILISATDTTAHRQADEALDASRELHRAIFLTSSIAVLILDGDRVIDCNAQAASAFGAPRQEMMGLDLTALSSPRQPDGSDSAARIREALTAARAGLPTHLDWTCRRLNGTVFEAALSLRNTQTVEGTVLIATVRDTSAHRNLERRLRTMATHDALTGLPNRRALLSRLDAVCRVMNRQEGRRCTLIRLNMDRFHLLNTSMGYAFGDEALMKFGERLKKFADEFACGDMTMPACLGGDEFAILLAGRQRPEGLAQSILSGIGEPLQVAGRKVHCQISMGIAEGGAGYSPQDLLRDAETALSRAERSGGARTVRFEQWMQEELEARAALEEDLRGALSRGELFTVYQPVVSLATGRPVGCEALLRWRHPVRGVVSPTEFIPIAEESDAILRLGEFAMARAAEQLKLLDTLMPSAPRLWMSVNLSKRQLHEEDVAERLAAIAVGNGAAPSRIKLEVTESIVMEDPEKVLSALQKLKDRGFGLAMDDFGTGQSSLSSLRRFPVDTLKIDRSFISGIGPDRQYAAVVNAIINLAHNLGLTVIAEGIEHHDQIAQLQALECDHGQGFLFSKPMDSAALVNVLQALNGHD